MSTLKKTVIAVATLSTLAVASAAPASAGQPAWVKPFSKGLGMGVGAGIGLGVTNAILNPRPNTVVVQPQPVYPTTCRQVPMYNGYGQFIGHQTVC